MVTAIDETVMAVLRGRAGIGAPRKNSTPHWPTARLVKIFIASTKLDFKEERKLLLEVVGPDLQSIYDERKIEVEMVDMHFGTGNSEEIPMDPRLLMDHLHEIQNSYELSKGCFFISLLGNKYRSDSLPERIQSDTFESIVDHAKRNNLKADLFTSWYKKNAEGVYEINDYSEVGIEEWKHINEDLNGVIQESVRKLITQDKSESSEYKSLLRSSVDDQCTYALGLSQNAPQKMIGVFREFDEVNENENSDFFDTSDSEMISELQKTNLRELKNTIRKRLPNDNILDFRVPWRNGGINPEICDHEEYLNKFKCVITDKVRALIDECIGDEPVEKGKKKTVPEIFQEHVTHVTLSREHIASHALRSTTHIDAVKASVQRAYNAQGRHAPLLIHGPAGCGKTTLLAEAYRRCSEWFDCHLTRIVRVAGATPRSAYNLELLRVLCQQMSVVLDIPEGYLPKDASFDPLYVNNWFQNILRRCEESANGEVMAIFIDDLHKLNPLDCDIAAALSWLPLSLPRNVFVICTSALHPDNLKLTPMQKERFRASDACIELTGDNARLRTERCNADEDEECKGIESPKVILDAYAKQCDSFEQHLEQRFDALEKRFGKEAFGKLASYITCSEFGLTETELLELLMPTSNPEAALELAQGNFNFSTFCAARKHMGPLLREKIMSGRLLIQWRHDASAEITRNRYLPSEAQRAAHAEIAALFFSQLSEDNEDSENDAVSEKAASIHDEDPETTTPFHTAARTDVTYNVRHVEESWLHLLRGGECTQLKEIAVCNFDFLLAAVQMVSISYLRCILEHIRCYILDRDIELVYYTIRKSSDVLTRDPMQLGAQVICWLRPVTEYNNILLSTMITSAMAWCDGYTVPLLVPLNAWLQPPLPLQIRTVTVSAGVRLMDLAPTGQHIVVVPVTGDPQLYHIMTNALVHTFKGHSGPVTCMSVKKQSQYLITGSEDTSIIVWDLKEFTQKLRIYEHIAPILCVACANNSAIISGGEDSSIIITSLANGSLVMKIDHHRGPVTSVRINPYGDVLVSASHDRTVCLWSLEDFSLLNTIVMHSPIVRLEISSDSVFMLAHCKDNGLYLRTLATGTELHALKGHVAQIQCLCLGMDSQRAVAGCSDQRVLVYDMHSGQLTRTMPVQAGPVNSVCVSDKDDFLVTSGGNKITFYTFRNEDTAATYQPKSKRASMKKKPCPTTGHVGCADVSQDGQLAATGTADGLVNIWQLSTHSLTSTFSGHRGSVTCVSFAPNALYVASGSEDNDVRVWGLTVGLIVSTFKGHNAPVECCCVMLDSRRVVSGDRDDLLCVWMADTATPLQACTGPSKCLALTNNMKFAMCTNGDSTLTIWSLTQEDVRYNVSHSEEITCFAVSVDSLHVITGSRDMSLKVWQTNGGKLAQVLVGHSDAVTCVAVSVSLKNQVISGSRDSNLIVWDIDTGSDLHTLAGHLAQVTCVKLTGDGTTAVSGSDDKTIIVWETKRGLALTSLQLHANILGLHIASDCARMAVHLQDSGHLPIVCLHNTPAAFVKMPTYSAPAKEVEDLRRGPKRPLRRLLKKEVSLDTYTWQRKYGHLTSSIMMAQVDEKLKRRFSVSASMEEISKLAESKNFDSQMSIGPEQAALAQSQHFDQLEALWNKRSPPRRRNHHMLSKQSSLVENRIDSSDEENEFEEEPEE